MENLRDPKDFVMPTAPIADGYSKVFVCVGPFCWGKAFSRTQAVANAKKNFSTTYAKKFCYILYEVSGERSADVYVGEMGGLVHYPDMQRIVEVERVGFAKEKKAHG